MTHTHQRIECDTMAQFMEVIAKLVERGLTFEADADTLTINLTGGF